MNADERELAARRAAALQQFEAWAGQQPEVDAAAALALAGGLYDLIEPARRERAIDTSGIQAMHAALRALG